MTQLDNLEAIRNELDALTNRVNELRRRLAMHGPADEIPQGDIQLVVCRIGTEQAAIFQKDVQEVVMACKLTPLPERAPWVSGMLNLRGTAIPVVDALARMQRRERRMELSDLVLICRFNGQPIGVIVQEVLAIRAVPGQSVQPTPTELPHAAYVLGLVTDEQSPTLLLSIPRLLALSELPESNA